MKTSTFKIEILAPIQEVWRAISTTEGLKAWVGWLKVETDWQLNSPIFTLYDEAGEVMESNGGKMIFNGVIEVKKENKEITYSYPEKIFGIEKESYVLDEIGVGTTCVTFTLTCTSEEKTNDREEDQKQLMEMLKLNEYLERNYNIDAIKEELNDTNNIYHIISYNDKPVGFSKIILNAKHPNLTIKNVTKLDRIYLLKEFYGLKLGLELLNFNIELSRNNNQSGIWLYTWIGNNRAINFYLKAGFTIIGSHKFYVTKTHYDLSHQLFLNFLDPKAN